MTASDPLYAAVQALKNNQSIEAAALLNHALHTDLTPQHRARATSLRAQAHLLSGDLEKALVDWREAWALVKDLEDAAGEKALRGLRREIGQLKAQRQAALAQKTQSRALLDSSAPLPDSESLEDQMNRLLERANAHFDCGEPDQGIHIAHKVLALAQSEASQVRFQVLGRLCLLRGEPERAAELLEESRRLADNANEPQLLGAVARAAKSLDYTFAPIVF